MDDSRFPQILMRVPLSAINDAEAARCLLSAAEAGRTDSSAPRLMRKERPQWRSHTVIVFFSHKPTAEFFSGQPAISRGLGWSRRGGSRRRDEVSVSHLAPPLGALPGLLTELGVVEAQFPGCHGGG